MNNGDIVLPFEDCSIQILEPKLLWVLECLADGNLRKHEGFVKSSDDIYQSLPKYEWDEKESVVIPTNQINRKRNMKKHKSKKEPTYMFRKLIDDGSICFEENAINFVSSNSALVNSINRSSYVKYWKKDKLEIHLTRHHANGRVQVGQILEEKVVERSTENKFRVIVRHGAIINGTLWRIYVSTQVDAWDAHGCIEIKTRTNQKIKVDRDTKFQCLLAMSNLIYFMCRQDNDSNFSFKLRRNFFNGEKICENESDSYEKVMSRMFKKIYDLYTIIKEYPIGSYGSWKGSQVIPGDRGINALLKKETYHVKRMYLDDVEFTKNFHESVND